MLEGLNAALDDGAGRRKKKRPKKAPRTTTRHQTRPQAQVYDPATTAYITQNIQHAAAEAGRPNRVYNLSSATPATAIALGGTTGSLTFTVGQDCYINSMQFPAAKSASFVCTSLRFGSFEIVGNGSMNMEILTAAVERHFRLVPVANRKLPSGTIVTGNFTNIDLTAAGCTFPGVAIAVIEDICVQGGGVTATKVAPGVLNLGAMRSLVRGMGGRRSSSLNRIMGG